MKYLIEGSLIRIRKTDMDDIRYVLTTERDVENEAFVGQWEEEMHKAALNNADSSNM